MSTLSPYSLVELDEGHGEAFLSMLNDYASADVNLYSALYERPRPWDKKEFLSFVKTCQRERMDWRPKALSVSRTRYVLLDARREICGNAELRFPLNDELERHGGNIWVDVPPRLRRQGFGTLTLNRMLFEAARAGLARLLVTCPVHNQAAQRMIEYNRGVLEKQANGQSYYWISLR